MNFLQVCQRVRSEAGISGVGPSSVVNQTGEMRRIVDWVNSSYEDIQLSRPNWNWLRAEFSFNSTINDGNYTPAQAGIATRFSQWDVNTIKSYRTSIGVSNEFELSELLYSRFRSVYLTNSQPSGTPIVFSIAPDRQLLLGPKPDAIFTVTGQYWKSPQYLTVDEDVPEMPAEYHLYIVWKALEMYALYESAAEVMTKAERYMRAYKNRLEQNQLPDIAMAEPLA